MTDTQNETPLKANEYKCSLCGGVFEYGWTEEEAERELQDNFGEIPKDECVVVCNDCYKKIMP